MGSLHVPERQRVNLVGQRSERLDQFILVCDPDLILHELEIRRHVLDADRQGQPRVCGVRGVELVRDGRVERLAHLARQAEITLNGPDPEAAARYALTAMDELAPDLGRTGRRATAALALPAGERLLRRRGGPP